MGQPSAMSLFWETTTGEVAGHVTYEAETGFGVASFNVPLVKLQDVRNPIKMNLKSAPSLETVKQDWPLGMAVRVKVSPTGQYIFAVSDPRRNYLVQIAVLLMALTVIAVTVASWLGAIDSLSVILGGIGLAFLILPLVIVIGRWQVGHPPPTAHIFWQTDTVPIVSTEIISRRIGNGTIRSTPRVLVQLDAMSEPVEVQGYLGSFRQKAERTLERVKAKPDMKVNIAPDGSPYEARWSFQHIVTVIATGLLPLFLFIGLVLLRVALPRRKAKS
jgi:hypothetical protein